MLLQNLSKSRAVFIAGFGTFETYTSKPRTIKMYTMKDCPTLEVPAKQRTKFRASKAFKDALNKNEDA